MEIVNPSVAVLSDAEVLAFIVSKKQHERALPRTRKERIPNLATVTYEAQKFLEDVAPHLKHQSGEVIAQFLKDIHKFGLSKSEKLQLLNLRPTTQCEMQLLIFDSEERYTEEQIDEMLEIIRRDLPCPELEEEKWKGRCRLHA
ncbi:unnamed protein product [Cyprideis torosa]|uniref:DNA-directed RNA polymerase III subunit RPC9 n=1 Tax=Cyprideis torosa TaxID=163714 RepID=A0A7R8ZR80_9CRUS|nr:unnamed protein product [Cyprideis torosa]CAG0903055.1 unnamed protein product [Cyprideis torosa]